MKKLLNLTLYCFLTCFLFGQGAYDLGFPTVGDSVLYMNDGSPDQLNPTFSSINDAWDFRNIKAPFAQLYKFTEPQYGIFYSSFEEADLLLIEPDKKERYFRIGEQDILEIGYVGKDPFFPFMNSVVKYEENPVAFRSSIQQSQHETTETYSYRMLYPKNELPKSLQRDLVKKIDTLEVIATINRFWYHMGTGKAFLPDDIYNVLCQKREENYTYRISLLVDGKKIEPTRSVSRTLENYWIDKTVYSYHYYKESKPLEMAILFVDSNDKVLSAKYMPSDINSVTLNQNLGDQVIMAFPNPTFGDIRFNFQNYEEGMYTIEVYNVIGKMIWSQHLNLDQSGIVKENMGHLRKGTYLYSIFDSDGKKLMTKRLVIITP